MAAIALLVLACGGDPSESQALVAVQATQTPSSAPSPSPSPMPAPTAQAEREIATPTVVIPVPTPTPTMAPSSSDRGRVSPAPQVQDGLVQVVPPDRDLSELAVRLRGAEVDDRTPEPAEPMSVGDRRDFWLTDLDDGSATEISATLMVVSANAYWFIDDAVTVNQAGLEEGARLFEQRVRPAVVESFGDIRSPGIDGDPRLIVLHSRLDGAAGYYGPSDEYPPEVHPHSNEGEIIYIDAELLPPGSEYYMSVLAHEFQHAIHFNQDTGEDSWVNEGLSELATEIAGYEVGSFDAFLPRPDTQLNYWPESSARRIAHYGSSALFFIYLTQRIGGTAHLKELMTEQLDGVAGVDAFLRKFGLRFGDVFADWVVANYLDADDERYGYLNNDVRIRRALPLGDGKGREMSLPQFSARYHSVRSNASEGTLKFQGNTEVRQVEVECISDGGCLWSGRGDSINSKATRKFDLTSLDDATLEYMVWYDIEEGWDYGYVEVSDDDGRTWTILEGEHTSDDDVSGNAYGPGYTGRSREWKRESIDLTPFAGGPVLVRFEYVTDAAVYRDGFMVADVSVPQLDSGMDTGEWISEGFTPALRSLPQWFVVQVVTTGADGAYEV
ncbi:MAG: immune inhibitor A, partial [Dehalococcoidia bacterium]|nr:immune inhibitor A [Dehalococcoidia bacterium]